MPFSTTERRSPESDFTIGTEQQVETLVGDLGRAIRAAAPRERAGLKELAETLLREEFSGIDEPAEPKKAEPFRRPFNPLAVGILLMILGVGIALVVPPVGLSVVAVAAALTAFTGVAASQQPATGSTEAAFPKNAPGYVVASDGRPVLNGFGSCLRTGAWSLATAAEPCDQIAQVSVPVPVVMYEQKPAPPPPPVAVVQPEPPRMVIQKLTLSTDVLFEFNKAVLKDAGKQKLDELADRLTAAERELAALTGKTGKKKTDD